MTGEPDPARPRGNARRETLRDLSRLLDIVGKPRRATPLLIALGLASSLAETVGITMILLFVYTAVGQSGGTILGTGMTQHLLDRAAAFFGSNFRLALVIMALIIARGALAMIYYRISSTIGERISERVRNRIHGEYLSVAYPFIQRHEQAELMEVLGTESHQVAAVYSAYTRLIINICSTLVFLALLLAISWKVTAVAIVGGVLLSLALRGLSAPAVRLGDAVKATHQLLGEHMLLTLQGMRTIRAYAQEEAHQRRFVESSRASRDISLALMRLASWLSPLTEVGYLMILAVIVACASWWNLGLAVTVGAVALLYRLQPHTRELEGNLLFIAQVQPQMRSVLRMLEIGRENYYPDGDLPITDLREGVEFRDVAFRYDADGADILRGVSFTLPAGKTTALIGTSGAGKTTIVGLLLRLYLCTGGSILVDGVPLGDLRRLDWLRLLAVAGQDVDLVEGTVIDNIRMAAGEASDDQVRRAAREAGVAEFVEPLPEGYDTWIGQEGMRFSGGQRQRIGLARALIRDPEFLILDEAMSALDRGLEDRVRAAIADRRAGRTMLVITHRLDTVRDAEHVIWLDQGVVRAAGPPSAVLKEAGELLDPSKVKDFRA